MLHEVISRRWYYITKILRPDEHLLAVGRLHWIIYKNAALAILLSIFSLHLARTYQHTNQILASFMAIVCVFLAAASAGLAIGALILLRFSIPSPVPRT